MIKVYEISSGEVLKSDGEGNRSLSIDENLTVYKHPCGTLSKLYLPVYLKLDSFIHMSIFVVIHV